MREFPDKETVYQALLMARQHGTDGWRTLAEIAGVVGCPRWDHIQAPVLELVDAGRVETRGSKVPGDHGPVDGPTLYRVPGDFHMGYQYFEGVAPDGATWHGDPHPHDAAFYPIDNPSVESNIEGWAVTGPAGFKVTPGATYSHSCAYGTDGSMVAVELHCPVEGCPNGFNFLAVDPEKASGRCSNHDCAMVRVDPPR